MRNKSFGFDICYLKLNYWQTNHFISLFPNQGQEKQATKRSSSNSPSRQPVSDKSYPEAVINNLLKLGATRADVLEALNTSNGDENSAKIKLLARMLQSPKK